MKKGIIFSLLCLAYSGEVLAQNFQGMAVYESKTAINDFVAQGKQFSGEIQKTMEDRLKKAFEKTFVLTFDKTASIYAEEQKLDAPNANNAGMKMMASFTGSGGTQYKNIKDKTYVVDKEFMGKEFLIKDSLPKLDWKLEGETKKIGEYTCFKATAIQKASATDFRNLKIKMKTTKPDDTKPAKTTNLMDQVDMPKEIVVTAWYTTDIPVSQGPETYWGLPGLILEISTGNTTVLCSKVVLNPKQKTEIKSPKNGKVVTQKEYDEIVVKKMEEMKQQFRGARPNQTIRIGG
ncbi:GLPGLI family protein [Flavobacterium kingsejongi]|uniref:GLPGLI family protein n=1 Tax=Flavobacterium kingsejongi TaxID=1678728 RepID=A0A2S1LN49_9FLAO|nr:GLPGLI family protein [Flavobacterium kingsejongi]AWG25154.1 GLPGLI family protein [Flavobacterium kingsejongi]